MTRLFSFYCRSLEAVMAVLLALMVVMVFANVVLRYGLLVCRLGDETDLAQAGAAGGAHGFGDTFIAAVTVGF